MSVIPVARMLFELGTSGAESVAAPGRGQPVVPRCQGSCHSDDELRAAAEGAHARGVAEGWERGRSERIQSEQQLLDRLSAEQEARLAALAQQASDRIEAELERLRSETSRSAVQALVAFFQGRIEIEAIEVLSNELRQVLTDQGAARVTFRGPKNWIDRLSVLPQVANSAGNIELQESDEIDVTVNIDGTLFETTIGDWLAGLGRVL